MRFRREVFICEHLVKIQPKQEMDKSPELPSGFYRAIKYAQVLTSLFRLLPIFFLTRESVSNFIFPLSAIHEIDLLSRLCYVYSVYQFFVNLPLLRSVILLDLYFCIYIHRL